MAEWITTFLNYADWCGGDLRELWIMFGISDDKWLNFLVDLEIRWEDGRLFIAGKFVFDLHGAHKAKVAMMYLYAFRRWSDSRWAGSGPPMRKFLGWLFIGLEFFVKHILDQKKQSKYYLKGFQRLTPDIKRMMGVVTCTSKISEVR